MVALSNANSQFDLFQVIDAAYTNLPGLINRRVASVNKGVSSGDGHKRRPV